MRDEQKYLRKLLGQGPVELRCIDKLSPQAHDQKSKQLIWSGVFDDYCSMNKSIRFAERMRMDTYTTINPIELEPTNEIKPFRRTAKDSDVSRINSIFFDFDPVRPTGTASTSEQIGWCTLAAMKLEDFLGWGVPTRALSGNGTHLVYTTDLPATQGTRDMLTGLYKALETRFGTDEISFGVTVRNPARIARLYGTVNRKSGRRAQCEFSEEFVDPDLILGLAKQITPPKETKRTWVRPSPSTQQRGFVKNFDVVGYFNSAGMYRGEGDGMHFVECPWAHEHSSDLPRDTAVWEGEWPQFHCFHAHCAHRSIKDVIEFFGESHAA